MTALHGTSMSGVEVPHGFDLPAGRFGRMFPTLAARKIGEPPLTDAQLESTGPIYLWYYLLKEAQVLGNGEHLGPVGSRIVAETLIGLLDADPNSYRSAAPQWRPTLTDGHFGIVDLLRIAGVPGTTAR